jgi:hypothetical protein
VLLDELLVVLAPPAGVVLLLPLFLVDEHAASATTPAMSPAMTPARYSFTVESPSSMTLSNGTLGG